VPGEARWVLSPSKDSQAIESTGTGPGGAPSYGRSERAAPKAELMALAVSGPHVDLRQFRADLDRVADQGL
jgi:hypothetical protein